jgi:hypothetical protein
VRSALISRLFLSIRQIQQQVGRILCVTAHPICNINALSYLSLSLNDSLLMQVNSEHCRPCWGTADEHCMRFGVRLRGQAHNVLHTHALVHASSSRDADVDQRSKRQLHMITADAAVSPFVLALAIDIFFARDAHVHVDRWVRRYSVTSASMGRACCLWRCGTLHKNHRQARIHWSTTSAHGCRHMMLPNSAVRGCASLRACVQHTRS